LRRQEDERLLTGQGRFVADRSMPGAAHGFVLRSPHAHATIRSLDLDAARAAPGVLAVLAGSDTEADGLGGIPWEVAPPRAPGQPAPQEGDPAIAMPQPLLARHRVRYVGEPVLLIVAERLHQARDAAELAVIDYEPLPAIVGSSAALAPNAPILHGSADNVCFRFGQGDDAATRNAFAAAATRVELHAVNQRLVAAPIECRGYAGTWDGEAGRWTLHAAAGKPHPIRRTLARFIFGVPEDRIRVVVGDVGGGFGAKNVLYAEAALVLWAARRLARPVRWHADRTDGFASDMQGRDHTSDAALALDADGHILAIRIDTLANLGAYLGPRGVNPVITGAHILAGTYRIPAGRIDVAGLFTNTVPTCPYRGAGAPEVIFLIERLIDLAAQALGLPADEIRRRNLLAPEDLPCPTVGGVTYADSDFPAVLERALAEADWAGFPSRRAAACSQNRLRGIGLAMSIEAYGTAFAEAADLRLAPDGAAELRMGTQSSGQSHATLYALLVRELLGLDARVIQGDTDLVASGNGTGASRSLTVGGSAVLRSCEAIIAAGLPHASSMLEAAAADIEFASGRYCVAGTDRTVSLTEIVRQAGGLQAAETFRATGYNFPYGCHVAEVEIDPATGVVTLARYTAVQDSGRAVLPAVVLGQMQGGIAQGVGQALLEHCAFDEAGQLITASFMDYAMPRFGDLPPLAISLHELHTGSNPLGAKAVGEAGSTGAPPAVINAIVDALKPFGTEHVEMPATPERVWRAIAGQRR
jgi:carbon-monoxide dehydrogenase large subunit